MGYELKSMELTSYSPLNIMKVLKIDDKMVENMFGFFGSLDENKKWKMIAKPKNIEENKHIKTKTLRDTVYNIVKCMEKVDSLPV